MKNIIKIIAVLATATSFFPMYSAEKPAKFFSISKLKYPLDVTKLSIHSGPFALPVAFEDGPSPLSENSVLELSAIKVIENPDTPDKNEILEKISNTFRQGASVTSNHVFFKSNSISDIGIVIPCQDPVPFYKIIKRWFAFYNDSKSKSLDAFLPPKEISLRQEDYRALILAIKQGKLSHKDTKHNVLTICTRDTLGIETPKELIDLILSLLPECNFDKEEKELT